MTLAFAAKAWSAATSGLGKAFTFIAGSQPAQIALGLFLAWIGYKHAIAKAKRQGVATGTEKTLDKIESETRETVSAMDEAENRVTADLNNLSLRELTKNDPDNAGRPKRP